MKRNVCLGLLTGLVVSLSGYGRAAAYDYGANWFSGLSSQLLSTVQFNNVLDANLNESDAAPPRDELNDRPGIPPATVGPNLAAAMQFQVSPELRQSAIERYVKQTHPNDRAAQQALRQDLNNLFQAVGPELARYNLDANNLADAYTVYWINAWQGSRGLTGDPTAAQIVAVREQVLRAFAATPAVMVTTDMEKQEMAEGFLVQAGLIASAVEQAQNNPELMRSIKPAIRQGAMTVGLDLDRMELTDEGFVLQ
ncbi:MAG: hypothetical protein RLZZ511_2491 [Cyanobacteriota bacterium]|jgi:hypothetical protein